MTEGEILERLGRRMKKAPERSGVVLGIGDDCAIFRPRPGEDLVFTTDMLLEDVHFRRDTHPPEAVGHKALARGLSDIAAMGAEPRFCLLSMALPPWAGESWIDSFYEGLLALGDRTQTTLAGGDLARAEKFGCDIVVCGACPQGTALRRDGARPGDRICVSGTLGGSALGLKTGAGVEWERHLRPEPRLTLGRFLREVLHATAAMDLSDGLSIDLQRLCLASGVSAELISAPPVFPGATLDQALHGGEDYELLFTVPADSVLPAAFGSIPLSDLGGIREGSPGSVLFEGRPLQALGWDHFR